MDRAIPRLLDRQTEQPEIVCGSRVRSGIRNSFPKEQMISGRQENEQHMGMLDITTREEHSMADADPNPEQDAVISEIAIAAPPERVFRALTDAGQLKRWFTSPECPVRFWEMEPRLDGAYRYATERGSIVVNGVSEFECHGHIVEYDPPRI